MRKSVPTNKAVVSPVQLSDQFESSKSQTVQWDIFNQRLCKVEEILIKMQKKTCKIQKHLNTHVSFQKQIQNSLNGMKGYQFVNPLSQQIRESFIQTLQNDIKSTLTKSISLLEAKGEQILKENTKVEFSNDCLKKLEEKINQDYKQIRLYVDKNIQELNSRIDKFFQSKTQTNFIDPKITNQTNIITSKSRTKDKSIIKDQNSRSKSRTSMIDQKDNTSRVSYLKQKLMQFQKVNKKYQKIPDMQVSAQKAVEKMTNFRHFLQQTESSIEPSQFQPPFSSTDPLPLKWKNLDQFTKKDVYK